MSTTENHKLHFPFMANDLLKENACDAAYASTERIVIVTFFPSFLLLNLPYMIKKLRTVKGIGRSARKGGSLQIAFCYYKQNHTSGLALGISSLCFLMMRFTSISSLRDPPGRKQFWIVNFRRQ